MLRERLLLLMAVLLGIALSLTRRMLVPDARWWNLVMAALLLGVLVLYLRRDHEERD